MMLDPDDEKIVNIIRERFEDQLIVVEKPYDFLTVSLKSDKIIDVIRQLHDHPEGKFQFLTTLCGVHLPEFSQISVVYQLHSLTTNRRIRLKIFLPQDNPVAPTLTTLFPSANWMERETFDFFGVKFEGHPDLRRILNVDEMIIFPMRKEYPLEDQTREDKVDQMFGR